MAANNYVHSEFAQRYHFCFSYAYMHKACNYKCPLIIRRPMQRRILDFLKGVRIRSGSREEGLALSEVGGLGGCMHPPEAMGYLILFSTKIPYTAKLECFKLNL